MKAAIILYCVFQLSCTLAADEYEEAGKSYGTILWRINTLKNEKPEICTWIDYGPEQDTKFNAEETYVALVTTMLRDSTGWNLFLWLGRQASNVNIDKALVLAINVAAKFKKRETYYMEIDGDESPLFKATFESAFQADTYVQRDPPKLYLVKGKSRIWAVRVPFHVSSLNQEDCFILDLGSQFDLFLYCGDDASKREQLFTMQLGNALWTKQHIGPKGTVKIVDNYSLENNGVDAFLAQFGMLSKNEFKSIAKDYGTDEEFEKRRKDEINIFRIRLYSPDESQTDKQLSETPLHTGILKTKDCYVVNTASSAGIYVFIGKESAQTEPYHQSQLFRALKMALAIANTQSAAGIGENERVKIHVVQETRAQRSPDFIFNFVESTRNYLLVDSEGEPEDDDEDEEDDEEGNDDEDEDDKIEG